MLSVVIPVYNEADSLPTLHAELSTPPSRPARTNRSSSSLSTTAAATDPGQVITRKLARSDPRVCGIRFRRNFGKAAGPDRWLRRGAGRGGLHPGRRPPGRPRRAATTCRPTLEEGLRCRQRLEANPARSLAQGLPEPRLQLAGQPDDRLPPARPQLRAQGVSGRGPAARSTSTASCTDSSPCWPTPAGSGSASGSSQHRASRVRPVEVRRLPVRQGPARPA